MKKIFVTSIVLGLFVLFTNNAFALLVYGQDIIAAPASVYNDAPGAENNHQQGFNEMQNVVLEFDIDVDEGIITAGTVVNSHMIFLNTPETDIVTTDPDVQWIFDGIILGVMSDNYGVMEAATNSILGAPGTLYPGSFNDRGLELTGVNNPDSYTVSGNSIIITMSVNEPGDWIRVITAPVPVPGSFLLLGSAMIGFAGFRRLKFS